MLMLSDCLSSSELRRKYTAAVTVLCVVIIFLYSNSHVNRIIRDYLCVPVWQYITAKKLDLAYNLIKEGYSAQIVAAKCGYSDYSVFYKSFVKHFGHSPSLLKSKTPKKDRSKTE
ncbi:MAG: AraC family transcriptional regulator [Clostridia bacterium]|nr:AraC family transcriptional regulator [Clostridia bacterium]